MKARTILGMGSDWNSASGESWMSHFKDSVPSMKQQLAWHQTAASPVHPDLSGASVSCVGEKRSAKDESIPRLPMLHAEICKKINHLLPFSPLCSPPLILFFNKLFLVIKKVDCWLERRKTHLLPICFHLSCTNCLFSGIICFISQLHAGGYLELSAWGIYTGCCFK